MTDLNSMIAQLERQRTAIDKALEALRAVIGEERSGGATKRGVSTEGRQRQIEAMRRYWAAKKSSGKKGATKNDTKKGGLTAAGRKALSENMKKRWAAKRAGEKRAAKKTG